MRIRPLILAVAMVACQLPALEKAWADGAPAILQPVDGASVSRLVTVVVSPGGAEPAGTMSGTMGGGMDMAAGGHLHLLLDSPIPKPGMRIPMDARHIHLMHGDTKIQMHLEPGRHTLQLVKGSKDHRVPAEPLSSSVVTITVK
jgi:hypothetical protein